MNYLQSIADFILCKVYKVALEERRGQNSKEQTNVSLQISLMFVYNGGCLTPDGHLLQIMVYLEFLLDTSPCKYTTGLFG